MTYCSLNLNIVVKTKALTIVDMSDWRLMRLRLMKSLSDRGMDSKTISQHMNDANIMTPRNKRYDAKIVWVCLNKYKNRLDRFKDSRIVSVKETLEIGIKTAS